MSKRNDNAAERFESGDRRGYQSCAPGNREVNQCEDCGGPAWWTIDPQGRFMYKCKRSCDVQNFLESSFNSGIMGCEESVSALSKSGEKHGS